ncbi:hypothetical protein ACFWR9_16615 [Streptomyces sp. NPDC058534]|uniref:hypothetical protein n=1 Tax=Streptomyces sp. NPDC058534 TaxID=3346541 RepID=UPI003652549F
MTATAAGSPPSRRRTTGWAVRRSRLAEARLWRAADIRDGLGRLMDLGPQAPRTTVRTFNGYAADGVDADLHRAEDPCDRLFTKGGSGHLGASFGGAMAGQETSR